MLGKTFAMRMCLCTLVLGLTAVSQVSAEIVAQYAGPTQFDGTSTIVSLDNCSIGTEGTLQLEFKADQTNSNAVLWYMADAWGGSSAGGEYRVWLYGNQLYGALWQGAAGAYAVSPGSCTFAFSDTTAWHTLRLTWEQGQNTLMTLDGGANGSLSIANSVNLQSFTSTLNALGGYPQPGNPNSFFQGSIRNVVLTNTFNSITIPEPSTITLMVNGVIGLLACAWRKRR